MPERIARQVEQLRQNFPALHRLHRGLPAVYMDGPAGTQVPESVMDAVTDYLRRRNANHGGLFATSRESDALLSETHEAAADFVGSEDPQTTVFGANMTSLTFHFSRSLAQEWQPGDEIVVTRLDHDANVRPWVLAARDRGAHVKWVDIEPEDCTLSWESIQKALSDKTRLVAVGLASNAVGTANPVAKIVSAAHDCGAEVFVDAVHWAPHRLLSVQELGCDYLCCSAYKFFGPHIGILWGRRDRLESIPAYKLAPVPDSVPDRWMTGTQNHECLAGVLAAIDYLADLGRSLSARPELDRRAALEVAYEAIAAYESDLVWRLIEGVKSIAGMRLWGITDRDRSSERLPTIAVTHAKRTAAELAEALGEQGIFSWHGNYYALELTRRLGLEPHGMLRLGLAHYNTREEVERVVAALSSIVAD